MHRHADIYRAMLPIPAKFCRYTLALFTHKSLLFCTEWVFGNPSCYFVSDWLTQVRCPVPYGAQPFDYIKYCVTFRSLRNRPNKPLCDITFIRRFLRDKHMTANKSGYVLWSMSMGRSPFSAKNQTLQDLIYIQSIYFLYDVGIISSAKCMKYK